MTDEADTAGGPRTLSDKIKAVLQGLRAEMDGVREICVNTGHRHPAAVAAMSDVVLRQMSMEAYLKSLEAIVAAERMTQRLEPVTTQMAVQNLPLFEGLERSHPTREHTRMMRTLHRAGDHTLDEGEAA